MADVMHYHFNYDDQCYYVRFDSWEHPGRFELMSKEEATTTINRFKEFGFEVVRDKDVKAGDKS